MYVHQEQRESVQACVPLSFLCGLRVVSKPRNPHVDREPHASDVPPLFPPPDAGRHGLLPPASRHHRQHLPEVTREQNHLSTEELVGVGGVDGLHDVPQGVVDGLEAALVHGRALVDDDEGRELDQLRKSAPQADATNLRIIGERDLESGMCGRAPRQKQCGNAGARGRKGNFALCPHLRVHEHRP
jgi:hypothetical protein